MTALMDDSGIAQVFAVLRARALSLPDHERLAYLAVLAVEEAGMGEAFASQGAVDLWSLVPAPRPEEPVVEAARVWDLTAARARYAPARPAVDVVAGPQSTWASTA